MQGDIRRKIGYGLRHWGFAQGAGELEFIIQCGLSISKGFSFIKTLNVSNMRARFDEWLAMVI